MEIYTDCPNCDFQNTCDLSMAQKSYVEKEIVCADCGKAYVTKGWLVYEEDESVPATKKSEKH